MKWGHKTPIQIIKNLQQGCHRILLRNLHYNYHRYMVCHNCLVECHRILLHNLHYNYHHCSTNKR